MGFLDANQPDIFISYARVDDQPFPGQAAGWVTTLVEHLKNLLDRRFGRREKYSIWMDPKLTGHEPLTEAIEAALRGTGIIVPFLSPGYLESEWCRRELATFLGVAAGRPRATSRAFVVEVTELPDGRPEGLREVLGYRAWYPESPLDPVPRTLGMPQPDPDDPRYYKLVDDLSIEIHRELLAIRKATADAAPVVGPGATIPVATAAGPATAVADAPSAAGRTVYLAEVTEDLDEARDDVRRYLADAGYAVVPGSLYPRDPAAFRAAVEADLARADVFVQLLGPLPGRRLAVDAPSPVALQHERAVAAGKPILQWRDRALDLATAAARNPLLSGADCLATGLEEFKALVVKRLKAIAEFAAEAARAQRESERHKKPGRAVKRVFVNAEATDRPLARAIGAALSKLGAFVEVPEPGATPADARKDLMRKVRGCHALMLVYGQTPPQWVNEQLRQAVLKYVPLRDEPLRAALLYKAPPAPKPELDVFVPADFGLRELDAPATPDEAQLRSFFEAI